MLALGKRIVQEYIILYTNVYSLKVVLRLDRDSLVGLVLGRAHSTELELIIAIWF